MDQDPTQLIKQRIAELPADVRNAVQAADLHQKILAVGAKNSLHIDQMGELEDEALLAMLGFSPLDTLGKRLSEALHLPPAAGDKLAADLAADIFGPIRESMKSFVEKRNALPTPTVLAPAALNATPAAPPASPDMHKADLMLATKTLDLPAQPPTAEVPAPIYKADPYREPV